MNFRRGHNREEPEINLIPMIDVLLVILIFLMVTTSYSNFAQLKINLPQADGRRICRRCRQTDQCCCRRLRALCGEQCAYRIQQCERLCRCPAQIGRQPIDPTIVIDADGKATHQSVINIMEAARIAGFGRITFTTQNQQQSNHSAWSGCNTTGIDLPRSICCSFPSAWSSVSSLAFTPLSVSRRNFGFSQTARPGHCRRQHQRGRNGQNPAHTLAGATADRERLASRHRQPRLCQNREAHCSRRMKSLSTMPPNEVGDEPLLMAQRALVSRLDRPRSSGCGASPAAGASRVRHHPERRRIAALSPAARCGDRRHRRCKALRKWPAAARRTVARTGIAAA